MLGIRLDSQTQRARFDPLLREFVKEVSVWVRSSLYMMVQVGNLIKSMKYTRTCIDQSQSLLVDVHPFRICLVVNDYLIGFTYECDRLTTLCEDKRGPRAISALLKHLLPEKAKNVMKVLASIEHEIVPVRTFFRPDLYPFEWVQEDKSVCQRVPITDCQYNPIDHRHPREILMDQIENNMLHLLGTWWCGSCQSLGEMGNYAKQVIEIIDKALKKKETMPRFVFPGEVDQVLHGLLYHYESGSYRYIVGIDMCGNFFDIEWVNGKPALI